MPVKHKIIFTYTKDLSVEIPDVETLLLARERISKYKITLDITSKPLKNKMIEVFTKLKYTDVEESKKKALFELLHSTVVEIEDEFEHAGVNKLKCLDAPGFRVKESPAHFECKYLSTHSLKGNSNHGYVDVVYGEVTRIHIFHKFINKEGKLDIKKIRPLARLGYYDYTSVTEVFEMRIPNSSQMTEDGLEGRSK